jgi:hypothetical protein
VADSPPRDSNPLPGEAPAGSSEVFDEAYERFKRCVKWEQTARQRFLDDYKMAQADAYNGYQWPNDLRRTREVDERPSLTLNGIRQHNLQIINDAKQNKPSIKAMPTGGGSTYESAACVSALFKHIEYISNATTAYDLATAFQVQAGWGYIRVETDYCNDDNNDQEIYIRRVTDPLSVYMDPEAKEADKSDAKFAFAFEDIEREEFEKSPKWSKYSKLASQTALGDIEGWMTQDKVRVADYWRVVEEADVLYALPKGFGGSGFPGGFVKRSTLKQGGHRFWRELKRALDENQEVTFRPLIRKKVEYKLIIGSTIVESESGEIPGKYIPLVPVMGEETIIEGMMDRVSHTRAMLDAQRMYNYAASSAVEFMGLQTKTPWLVATESIEELETYWNNANRINTSALPFKAFREDGTAIPPPQRIAPPTAAPIYAQQMQASLQDLLMTSGQFAAQMGGPGNERSAKAIGERQRQSDNATYHFVDNLAIAIRQVGRIIMDLIPKIYDTKRVLQILADDGTTLEITIDPQAQQHHQKVLQQDVMSAQHVLNPQMGQYEVDAEIGPNYATRREETAEAMKLILTQSPQLTGLLGDIFLRALDFDQADEAAQRLKRMVPAHALGEGPSQTEQALGQQVQQLQNLLSNALTELATERLKLRGKESKDEVAVYNALTDRLKMLVDAAAKGEAQITPETLKPVVSEAINEALGTSMQPAEQDIEQTLGGLAGGAGLPAAASRVQPPVNGAKQDADGNWWARDFSQSKGYKRLS